MSKGRNNKLMGQIGEYLVCAELGRRGFIATSFSGNVPTFDVLATDEICRAIPIQVKASNSDNWNATARDWMDIDLDLETGVQTLRGLVSIANPDLIYVCVAIAKADSGAHDRFFVLTKSDIQQAIVKGYSAFMDKHNWKRPRSVESFDARYFIPMIEQFENNWGLIASRIEVTSPSASLRGVDEQSQ